MFRRAGFNDLSLIHEHHPVADLPGKTHLVGDHHHGHPFLGQVDHDVEYLADHLRVEGRGRFVEEHDLGVHGQGAGDGHALLLAAGKLRRVTVSFFGDTDLLEQRIAIFSASSLAIFLA